MADEGRDFQINFTADARQAVAASRDVAAAVGQVAETTEKTATNTKKLAADTDEATESTRKHKSAHGELHKAMKLIEEQAPQLGVLLKTALSPAGGAIMAVIAIYQHFNAELEETNRKLDEMGAEAAKGFGNMKESAKEAGDTIEANRRSIKQWAEDLSQNSGRMNQYLSEEIAKLNETTEATENLIKAQADLARAKVDESQRAGEITDAEAILRKAEIDRQSAHASANNRESRTATEYAITKDALNDIAQQGVGFAAGFQSVVDAANDKTRETLIKDLPKRIEDLKAALPGSKKNADAAWAEADKADQEAQLAAERSRQAPGNTGMAQESVEAAKRAAEAHEVAQNVQGTWDKQKAAITQSEEKLKALTAVQEDWNQKLKMAQREVEENKHVFDELSGKLEMLRIKMDGFDNRQRVLNIQDQTAGARAFGDVANTDIGKLLYAQGGGASDAAWKMLHGQKPGAVENDQLQTLLKFLGANNGNQKRMLEIIASAHESAAGQQEAIGMIFHRMQELAKDVNLLKGQVRNSRNNVGG